MNVRTGWAGIGAMAIAALTAAVLAGCAGQATPAPTAAATSIAATATKALGARIGASPVDCGAKGVAVVLEKSVICHLTDGATGDVYPVRVTFTEVQGATYEVRAVVADTPSSTGTPATTIPSTDVAALAAQALGTPALMCADTRVPMRVGFVEVCGYAADGATHHVDVTITRFDGTNYSITARVVS